MATIRHANSVKILPQEICGLICQDPTLTRPDLFSLGAVSRAFRDEAERFLYTSARLRGKRKIKSFCVSVIRRPFLAVRLRQLVLFMPPQLDLEVDDLSRIMKALRLCNNLRHLSVFQDYSRAIPQLNADAVHSWILDGHSFRLKSLANSYFEPGHLVRFLKHQPSIETLAIKCKGYSGLDSAPLPMLKNLDSSARVVQEFGLDAWHRTTMERLQFSLIGSTDSEELTTFVALTPFTSTLKSLSIRRKNGDDGLDISVLVACVATQLPDLKFLQILDYTAKMETYHVPFLPFPIVFTKIETLVLRPPTRAYRSPNEQTGISSYRELRTNFGRRCAADRLMTSLPSLKRLVLIDKNIYEYTRTPDDGEICEQSLSAFDERLWLKVQ